jgi:hypothetical protein
MRAWVSTDVFGLSPSASGGLGKGLEGTEKLKTGNVNLM